ncbi:MAG: beta-galactosidase, partial [Rhizomicrobium sp.]
MPNGFALFRFPLTLIVMAFLSGSAFAQGGLAAPDTGLPRLVQNHGSHQLVVDGAPFLILGGELENSTASDRTFLGRYWNKLAGMGLNTVIAPVSWELIEPREGTFDFSSVDFLLADARQHHMRLVLLWFGSWKNSMSSYAPDWVKRDQIRFARSHDAMGAPQEILSPTSANVLAADSAAFRALMVHLKTVDAKQHSVVMVQVENEVGMLPDARDHSADADAAFAAPVPKALTDYLTAHLGSLAPALKAAWQTHGSNVGASWTETFGAGIETDEIFNAWC